MNRFFDDYPPLSINLVKQHQARFIEAKAAWNASVLCTPKAKAKAKPKVKLKTNVKTKSKKAVLAAMRDLI